MNSSRILACVGAFTLYVVACNDKDVSIVEPGNGGSGGNGGSNTAGNGGSGVSGSGGSPSAGAGGSMGGAPNAGSGGVASAGTGGVETDAGADATAAGPYAELCADYCAVRTAWATATTDGGVNCAGWDGAACQAACEAEVAGFVEPPVSCPAYATAAQCFTTADAWFCGNGTVFSNDCVNTGGAPGCDSTCDAEAAAVLACFG